MCRINKIILLTLVFLLSGCVGKVDNGPRHGSLGDIFIDGNRICFSVDKNKILENYEFTTVGNEPRKLLSGRSTHLSYPESCFMAPLEKGVIYRASYMLDKKNYYDVFIISREGHVIGLWTYSDCPSLSVMPF